MIILKIYISYVLVCIFPPCYVISGYVWKYEVVHPVHFYMVIQNN
jgi:hypothetical protein